MEITTKVESLRELRKSRRLTLRDVENLGVCAFTYLCAIEKGVHAASTQMAEKLAKAYGVECDDEFLNLFPIRPTRIWRKRSSARRRGHREGGC